jgi:hypothetical protein
VAGLAPPEKERGVKKNFLILAAAVFLLAAVLWVKQYREGAPRRSGFVFDTTRAGEMKSLRVQYHRDSMQLLQVHLGREGWVTEDGYPVDTARLRVARGWLLRLRAREKVSDAADTQSLWEYGLNPEDARMVEWTWASGDTVRILLGKTSTLDYSFTYWKWKEPARGGAVYRTPGNFIWELSPRAADWKEKSFWTPFVPEDVRAVTVDWRDSAGALRHYKVERAGTDSFRLAEPEVAPVSRRAAEKLFEKAAQFTADDFGLELDPNAGAALERIRVHPAIIVRILLKNGKTHTLRAGPIFREYQYTRHPYHPNLVAWVFKWRYDYFKLRPEDLKNPG